MKKLRVTVDGKPYEVLVEILDEGAPAAPARPAPVQSAQINPAVISAPATSSAPVSRGAAAPGDVVSPLAGKVVSIDVQPGQTVEANAQLLTLEAMKMNTYVFSQAAGTVKEVLVQPGDAVEEGQVLVKMS